MSCEHELPENAAFCPSCGAAIARCPVCTSLLPAHAVFCGRCGTNLRELEATGEYDVHHERDFQRQGTSPEAERLFLSRLRPRMAGFLYDPRQPHRYHPLHRGENTIGSGVQNTIVIAQDTISWTHALVVCRHDHVLVQDSASTNGTHLNGVMVSRPVRARHGDVIRLADVDFALWLRDEYRMT